MSSLNLITGRILSPTKLKTLEYSLKNYALSLIREQNCKRKEHQQRGFPLKKDSPGRIYFVLYRNRHFCL